MNTFITPDWESSAIDTKSAKQLLSLPLNNKIFKKHRKVQKKKGTHLKENLTNTKGINRKNVKAEVKNEKFSLHISNKQKNIKKKRETPLKGNLTKIEGMDRKNVKSKVHNEKLSFNTSINKPFLKSKIATNHKVMGNNSRVSKDDKKIGKQSPIKSGGQHDKKVLQKVNKKKSARLIKRNKQNKNNIDINANDCMKNKVNQINTTENRNIMATNKHLEENKTFRSNNIQNKKRKLIDLLGSAPVPGQKKRSLTLKDRMIEKLKASRFRYINEQIYNSESKEAHTFFRSDPDAFYTYHEGYRQQVSKWPLNPLDVIIKSIKKMPVDYVIADFGCGEANLAKSVPQQVHSFDLVSMNEYVTACDMSHVPLENDSVNVVVFCLSLMGTNIREYLFEANRVLKNGGRLKIAEVESRFDTSDVFIEGVKRFGFKNTWKDLSHNLFCFIDFEKVSKCKPLNKLPTVGLHPCLYKKR